MCIKIFSFCKSLFNFKLLSEIKYLQTETLEKRHTVRSLYADNDGIGVCQWVEMRGRQGETKIELVLYRERKVE